MTRPSPRNVAASVRQRLLNRARALGTDYNQLLVRYAIERFLYRLATSPHRGTFVLKGAMLFAVWDGSPHRPTQDLDLLGFGERSENRLVDLFREVCSLPVEDDGLRLDPASVRAEEIRPNDDYGGIRVTVTGDVGGAVVRVRIDVGFGDAVTPAAIDAEYPAILDGLPRASLRVYPRETVVAEKLEAIAKLGMLNTRFKDYYDLYYLSHAFEIDGATLTTAIMAAFTHRGTQIPDGLPVGVTATFALDPTKQTQRQAFRRRLGDQQSPESLAETITALTRFIAPPLGAASNRTTFERVWTPAGQWGSHRR